MKGTPLSIKIDLLRAGMLSTLGLCNNLLHILEAKHVQQDALIQVAIYRDSLGALIDELRKINEDTVKSVVNDESKWIGYLNQKKENFLGISEMLKAEAYNILPHDGKDDAIARILRQIESIISDLRNLPV